MKKKVIIAIVAFVSLLVCCNKCITKEKGPAPYKQEVKEMLEEVNTQESNIYWILTDSNNAYIGFSDNSSTEYIRGMCQQIALSANTITDFGYHVWACKVSAKEAPPFDQLKNTRFIYEVTARHGKIER